MQNEREIFYWPFKPKLNKTSRILISANLFHNISTYFYIIILVTSIPVFNKVVVIDADVVQ